MKKNVFLNSLQQVDIYLDPYATHPTLNYLFDFIKHKEDKNRIRLFGINRFSIPESIIDMFPSGNLQYIHMTNNQEEMLNKIFFNIISQQERKLSLVFHLNLSHSWELFLPLWEILYPFIDNVVSIKVHLYDDGSEGLVDLYKLKMAGSEELKKLSLELDKIIEIKELDNLDNPLKNYTWSKFFDSSYHFLLLDKIKDSSLSFILNQVDECCGMELSKFKYLDDKERKIYLDVLQLPKEIYSFIDQVKDMKMFLFTGTTLFGTSKDMVDFSLKLHMAAINNYLDANGLFFIGEEYVPIIKGHPNNHIVNRALVSYFPNLIHLPDNIPFEILYLLGLKPELMGGFASTSYFSYPKDNIADILFITDPQLSFSTKKDREFNLLQSQRNLMETMVRLNFVDGKKVHYYSELRKN